MDYSIKQVSEKTNLKAHVLRYYEREGLLPNVSRSESGIRRYSEEDLEWLGLICCLKNTGMPIKKIKQFTDWQNEGNQTLHPRNDMLENHKEDILTQIEDLKKHLRLIDRKLDYYHDACQAYDTNSPIPTCCEYTDDEF